MANTPLLARANSAEEMPYFASLYASVLRLRCIRITSSMTYRCLMALLINAVSWLGWIGLIKYS